MEDADAATSRSSAKRVATMVVKFTDLKRKLVNEIGFGGLLHIPQNNKVCRKFTVWLLSKIDVSKKCIVISENVRIPIRDVDMEMVLGIPCGPKKLHGLEVKNVQDKLDFIKFAIGSVCTDPDETSSLKAAEDIISKEYPNGMNFEETERFKVAFVVFVTGHFLVAKTRHNHGFSEYWGSLLVTSEIKQFNFCSYVIDELIESAKKVQRDLGSHRVVKNVTGCSLGLQVFYIESFTLVEQHARSRDVPKFAIYDCETMTRMVKLMQDKHQSVFYKEEPIVGGKQAIIPATISDRLLFTPCAPGDTHSNCVSETSSGGISKNPEKNVAPDGAFVTYRPNIPAVSTYLTAYIRGTGTNKLTYKQIDDLKWHNARMTLHIRKTKSLLNEVLGGYGIIGSEVEVHMEDLMAKVHQDNLSLAQRIHSHQESLIGPDQSEPPSKRINTDSGSNCGSDSYGIIKKGKYDHLYGKQSGGCKSGSSNNSGGLQAPQCFLSPIQGKQLFTKSTDSASSFVKTEPCENSATSNRRSYTTKSQNSSGSGNFARIRENYSESITVPVVIPSQLNGPLVRKIKCSQGQFAKSPWQFGSKTIPNTRVLANALYDNLVEHVSAKLLRNWIVHSTPRYIDLNGHDLKDVFVKRKTFSRDVFDMAIRRYNQLDRWTYGPGIKKMWRKSFESDFADMAINGEDPLLNVSIIDQFTMSSGEYDISECRMVLTPAIIDFTWCCYFWDMQEKIVHIVDPTFDSSSKNPINSIHTANVEKISTCLTKCMKGLFDGWSADLNTFKHNCVHSSFNVKPGYWTGLLTLIASRDFDGVKMVTPHTEESLKSRAKQILYDIVSIEGNYGTLPSAYVQCIED